jgi:DNA repair protein RecO (recombination protein O)
MVETKTILLKVIPHSDSTCILHLYSEKRGPIVLSAKGLTSRKSKKRAWLQLLNQLTVGYEERDNREIFSLKSIQLDKAYKSLSFDPVKSSIAMFLCECLGQILKESNPDEGCFKYCSEQFFQLDEADRVGTFHLRFLAGLAQFSGISPNIDIDGVYFDLQAGESTNYHPGHGYVLEKQSAKNFISLFKNEPPELNRQEKKQLLSYLIQYYQLHLGCLKRLKSLDVLEGIFA